MHARWLWLVPAMVGAASAQDLSAPGPYGAGKTELTVTRPDSSTFTAVLYYPATSTGDGTPYDPAGSPYPGISFGHGYLQAVEQYDSTLRHLASWGYWVMASRSAGGFFPNHGSFAADLRYCLDWLEAQNATPGSALYEQVDPARFGVSGHSMGGGASILAAAADARVRTVANMAAADTNPSAITASGDLTVPSCLICGSSDTIVPPANHGQLMYANADAPRQLPMIAGGFHCGFTDEDFLFCDSGSISRATQLAITRRLLTAWFNLYLKQDPSAWPLVWGEPMVGDAAVMTTFDPGVLVQPAAASVTAHTASTASVDVLIRNTGARSTSYTLFAEAGTWSAVIVPAATVVLGPGQEATASMQIDVPAAPAVASQRVLISARSDEDGGTRGFAGVDVFATPPADFDLDRDVDSDDLDLLIDCAAGPGVPITHACAGVDLDADGDADAADFGVLQRCFAGSISVSSLSCAD